MLNILFNPCDDDDDDDQFKCFFFFASLEHISCFFCLKFIKSRKRFVDKCKFQSGRGRVEASKGVVSFHADLLLCCFFYELNTRSAPF